MAVFVGGGDGSQRAVLVGDGDPSQQTVFVGPRNGRGLWAVVTACRFAAVVFVGGDSSQ